MQEERPWGRFEILAHSPTHWVKRITVHPNQRLSLQYHNFRVEHWFVTSGAGVATVADAETPVEIGSHIFIPLKATHRMACRSNEPLIFIEVVAGTFISEDDIVRVQDDYGR